MENKTVSKLHELTQRILQEDDAPGYLKGHIEELQVLLTELTGISPFETLSNKQNTDLSSGVAISPGMAAFCSIDIKRTQVFLRGVLAGLKHQLSVVEERPLQVVYAGTGPYALLVLPLLSFFESHQLKITFLDIHQSSLDSVKKLVDTLGYQSFVQDIVQADAATWQWDKQLPLHACISETMQVTLKREPQVAITLNLVPQLAPAGIMIPEQIEVEAVLVNMPMFRMQSACNKEGDEENAVAHPLGLVAQLNKETALQAKGNVLHVLHGLHSALLPEWQTPEYTLQLQTRIQVWGPHQLKDNDSGLTLPYELASGQELTGGKNLHLYYANYPDAFVRMRVTD